MAADARVLEGEGDEGEEGRRGGGEEGEGEGERRRGTDLHNYKSAVSHNY